MTPSGPPVTVRAPSRALSFGFVLAVVVLQVLASYIPNRDLGRLFSVLLLFAVEMPVLFFSLDALFGWANRRHLRAAVVVVLGMALSSIIGAVSGALFWVLAQRFPELGLHTSTIQPLDLSRMVLFGFTQTQSHFGLWTLASLLPAALEEAQARRFEAEQLRVAAELTRLRANLEPHFLLNTLNAIAGLVTEDPREARALLAALGDLLRDALRDEDELQSVGAQMKWLQRYAEILEVRHRGELSFAWDVGPNAVDVQLPRLLLQPLVENAVAHGALKRGSAGHVSVRVALEGSTLVCEVGDDGPGLAPGPVREGAFGMQSVRRRLELRYGEAGRLTVDSSSAGTRARVELPVGATP
jgi:sensor histidine kinase YesM